MSVTPENWLCYVASHATEHAAELDRHAKQRLLALPSDLWLDVCGDCLDYQDEEDGQPNGRRSTRFRGLSIEHISANSAPISGSSPVHQMPRIAAVI